MEKNIGKEYQNCWELIRLLGKFELFKKILDVKGSIVECGVWQGRGLISWAKISSILEPVNISRKIYGFDTFEGYPIGSDKDVSDRLGDKTKNGNYYSSSLNELKKIIKIYDSNRFLGHIEKVFLIKGDANKTIPAFIENNPYIIVSLLYLDFGLYEPTKIAIKYFYPRMPKGGIIATGELDRPRYMGVTIAIMEELGIGNIKIKRFNFEPYVSYMIKE